MRNIRNIIVIVVVIMGASVLVTSKIRRAQARAWEQGFKAGLNAERYILKPVAVNAMIQLCEVMQVEDRTAVEYRKNPYANNQ
jgi:hypothetical protein